MSEKKETRFYLTEFDATKIIEASLNSLTSPMALAFSMSAMMKDEKSLARMRDAIISDVLMMSESALEVEVMETNEVTGAKDFNFEKYILAKADEIRKRNYNKGIKP